MKMFENDKCCEDNLKQTKGRDWEKRMTELWESLWEKIQIQMER